MVDLYSLISMPRLDPNLTHEYKLPPLLEIDVLLKASIKEYIYFWIFCELRFTLPIDAILTH
jgi:hypothetical protein